MEFIVEDYSDRSFVVRGEKTIKFKKELLELGGKYNPNLKNGAGWIFSTKIKENVLKALGEMEEYVYLLLKGNHILGVFSKKPEVINNIEYTILKLPIDKNIDVEIPYQIY